MLYIKARASEELRSALIRAGPALPLDEWLERTATILRKRWQRAWRRGDLPAWCVIRTALRRVLRIQEALAAIYEKGA